MTDTTTQTKAPQNKKAAERPTPLDAKRMAERVRVTPADEGLSASQ